MAASARARNAASGGRYATGSTPTLLTGGGTPINADWATITRAAARAAMPRVSTAGVVSAHVDPKGAYHQRSHGGLLHIHTLQVAKVPCAAEGVLGSIRTSRGRWMDASAPGHQWHVGILRIAVTVGACGRTRAHIPGGAHRREEGYGRTLVWVAPRCL